MILTMSNVLEILNRDGGMLLSQLYENLPKEDRPSYSTFTRFMKSVPGVKYSQVFKQSPAKFITVLPRITPRKKKILVLLTELRLQGIELFWYVDIVNIPSCYNRLKKHYPNARYFDENSAHLTLFLKNSRNLSIKSPEKERISNIAPILYGLVRRGVYPIIRKNKDDSYELRWFYLDSSNQIFKSSYRSTFALICAFMSYHNMDMPWSISVLTWDDKSIDLYKHVLKTPAKSQVDNYSFKDKFLIDGSSDARKSELLKRFNGLQFESINISRYFTKVSVEH